LNDIYSKEAKHEDITPYPDVHCRSDLKSIVVS
jgi:hypothetical protein